MPARRGTPDGNVRVLHVAEGFGGGVYEVVRMIAEGHATAGHTVAIAYARRPVTPTDVRSAVDARVELMALDWRRASPVSHLRAARRLASIARSWKPDVVHLHSSFAGIAGAFGLAGRVPLVYTPHALASRVTGSRAVRLVYECGERWTIARCDVVGAVSASEASEAAALGADRLVTVLNGIPELDDPPAVSHDDGSRPRVVAGGRLAPQRRPDACARVLSQVADVADVAWIGGRGDGDPPDAGAALAAAGVPVTGWLPREDALAELRGATAYLHWTSWDAGAALAVLEAMAVDAIVVASDIPPNRDAVGAGQVFSSEDEAAAFLRRVVSEKALRDDLIAAQHERRGAYSARAMVGGWMKVYEAMTAAGVTGASRRRRTRRSRTARLPLGDEHP